MSDIKDINRSPMSDDLVWEIFTNPNNLSVYLTQEDQLYGFVIAQKNPYKKFDFFDCLLSHAGAIELAKTRLQVIHVRGLEILNDSKNLKIQAFNPDKKTISELSFFNFELLVSYLKKLEDTGEI